MKEYRKESWIDPRIEVRESATGQGMYASAAIAAGEIVTIWGGTVFTNDEKRAGLVKKYSASRIDENHWLGSRLDEPTVDDMCLNHSCNPNIWMINEVTFAARRNISPGAQITADYSTWSIDDTWVMDEPCRCGSPLCRHTITGEDWKLPELQERYRGHFVPFINDRIAAAHESTAASKSLELARQFLGKEVEVTIDRPLGSRHPKHGFVYEVNYGHIKGVVAPDGEDLDAYYLGVSEPLTKATGVCIAIIHRLNDDDDKLVVVPAGLDLSDEEIRTQTHFQEQWFMSEIIRSKAK